VAAIAAVYLASRHAADPINGVVKAAFAIGSDTDTIASMTGGLLGCINGSDWLSPVRQGIQDATYIEKCASRLAAGQVDEKASVEPVMRTPLKNWIDNMAAAHDMQETRLPDRRNAKVNRGPAQVGRSGKYKVDFLTLTSEDGQTIYINKISKENIGAQPAQQQTNFTSLLGKTSEDQRQPQSMPERFSFGPKLPVSSLEKSVRFYKGLLGLSIKKESQDVVVFHQGLVLTPASYAKYFSGGGFRTILYVEVSDIPNKFMAVKENNVQVVTKLENWRQSTRRFFRCLDPDGNLIEIFEKR